MAWDGMRRRAEDSGGESPETILARIDERLKSFLANFDKHIHEDKNSFALINARVEVEAGKIRKEIETSNTKSGRDIDFLKMCIYMALGAGVLIQLFVVPVVVQAAVKKIIAEQEK